MTAQAGALTKRQAPGASHTGPHTFFMLKAASGLGASGPQGLRAGSWARVGLRGRLRRLRRAARRALRVRAARCACVPLGPRHAIGAGGAEGALGCSVREGPLIGGDAHGCGCAPLLRPLPIRPPAFHCLASLHVDFRASGPPSSPRGLFAPCAAPSQHADPATPCGGAPRLGGALSPCALRAPHGPKALCTPPAHPGPHARAPTRPGARRWRAREGWTHD